jgi:uracil phosphoribosyltransferase
MKTTPNHEKTEATGLRESFIRQIKHPILAYHLTLLRKKETQPAEFRRILAEMSRLLAYEATSDLKTKGVSIETPLEKMPKSSIIEEELLVVSIMRAGNGMLEGVLQTLPFAQAGHIGIYRDKFVQNTVEYFFRLPEDPAGKPVLLLDPLLATGDTAAAAIQRLKDYGVGPIRLLTVLSCPQGLEKVQKHHPETLVYTVSIERSLNENGYLLPGLGDAGDRLYGTTI